jgi:hypothetical protein
LDHLNITPILVVAPTSPKSPAAKVTKPLASTGSKTQANKKHKAANKKAAVLHDDWNHIIEHLVDEALNERDHMGDVKMPGFKGWICGKAFDRWAAF